jgi:hypothetical protein
MPEVSATSNSTWGALLRTTVAETIQPKVDRWRSGLDAILVFVGEDIPEQYETDVFTARFIFCNCDHVLG